MLILSASSASASAPCQREGSLRLRDVHWRAAEGAHPLVGQVLKGEQPIEIKPADCTRSPLQQLIADVWASIHNGGIVLLGEVHDNPEHHAVRGDILWPRLENAVDTPGPRPAAVFEHIRASQQPQLDRFYDLASRSRRLLRAPDLLRALEWNEAGWPAAEMFYPLFDAALGARLPIRPGNADRARMRALVKDQSTADVNEVGHLRLARALPQELVAQLDQELEASHCGMLPQSAIPPVSLAQRFTDAHLAAAVVNAAAKHGSAFLIAGNGHIRTDRGVPWYVRQLAPGRGALAVALLEVEEGKRAPAAYVGRIRAAAADYVLFTPRQPRPDPCEKMRGNKP